MIGLGRAIFKEGESHPKMIEFRQKCPGQDPHKGLFVQLAGVDAKPRTMMTHIPLSHFPENLLDTAKVRT